MPQLHLPMRGGCICGAVRYQVTGQPVMMSLCHCTTCQRRTGSAYSMSLVVRCDDFMLVQGVTIARDLPTDSGRINAQHFCEACLVRTHTEPAAFPDVLFVRPGTLDDPKSVEPIAQLWTRSARNGAMIEGLRAFPQNMDAEAVLELRDAWRVLHPVALS